jgi:hypothetical protein
MMNKQKWMALLAAILVVLMTASIVLADVLPSIDWWVISGGGAPVAGGDVILNSSLGQPVIGHSEGGDVALEAGYWVINPEYVLYLPVVLR